MHQRPQQPTAHLLLQCHPSHPSLSVPANVLLQRFDRKDLPSMRESTVELPNHAGQEDLAVPGTYYVLKALHHEGSNGAHVQGDVLSDVLLPNTHGLCCPL